MPRSPDLDDLFGTYRVFDQISDGLQPRGRAGSRPLAIRGWPGIRLALAVLRTLRCARTLTMYLGR